MLFETTTIEGVTVVILRATWLTKRNCVQLKRAIAAEVSADATGVAVTDPLSCH